MMNYEEIKQLAGQMGLKVNDLVALAPGNDPFYTGTPGDLDNGQWFADLWHRFGYGTGVHLRRVHYQIISQKQPVKMPNGLPYENTEKCWGYLAVASKAARYLKLVDPAAFVDRRNPDPTIFTPEWPDPSLSVELNLWRDSMDLPDFPDLPQYALGGWDSIQAYHFEVWCEKSTMNDVLLPLCRQYGANLVTGVGEMSITSTMQLVTERMNPDRPTRVFYVSDFDPAGQSMPVAVARKVEYFIRSSDRDLDLRLFPLVLTVDQVREHRLPRTPIKDSERRKGGFVDRFGAGAVELDALEALYPGTLARILRSAMDEYFDHDLWERKAEEWERITEKLADLGRTITDPYTDELTQIRAEYEQLRAEYTPRVKDLADRIQRTWLAIADEMEDQMPDTPAVLVADRVFSDGDDLGLYNSDRSYFDQMNVYKQHQGKDVEFA